MIIPIHLILAKSRTCSNGSVVSGASSLAFRVGIGRFAATELLHVRPVCIGAIQNYVVRHQLLGRARTRSEAAAGLR